MSIKSMLPCSHLTLCRPLFFLPSVFPSIRVFSNESVLCIRWPKYWRFSFNISPSNEHPGLISFRMTLVGGKGKAGWAEPQKICPARVGQGARLSGWRNSESEGAEMEQRACSRAPPGCHRRSHLGQRGRASTSSPCLFASAVQRTPKSLL